ncbi:FKBP-type peptidyl-prolyl cis-trans isomerase [Rudaeicoccus suwonensis]|uniref:Peptidyl-prolyl cis-trans isomerase n=1 Tax=Rudaeicoccus suwonensis TaxID=657409 RepID=A0A561EAZ4_9MICO|nr:FKBP-type peptidyl-prolyl cis-trans isomerase [Rudaeicoccus suwonensis]TWE12778.1 peptidylprolyl isomerase [Rudaeicoccus suwonensis]
MVFNENTTKPDIDFPGDEAPADLVIEDIEVGDGPQAQAGDQIRAHYVGVAWSTGEEFDSSWNRGEPLGFQVGVGQVIPGWDQGLVGMKVGGRRKLTIPSHLAYGDRGAGSAIGPGETLIFVVDLVSANKPGAGAAFGIG